MMNAFPGGDPLSSIFLGQSVCAVIGIPFILQETVFSTQTIIAVVILGVFQLGLAYIIFSIGIKKTSPVAASLIAGIEPVMNPILAAIFAKQYMKTLSIIGALVVILSIVTYNVIKQMKTEK